MEREEAELWVYSAAVALGFDPDAAAVHWNEQEGSPRKEFYQFFPDGEGQKVISKTETGKKLIAAMRMIFGDEAVIDDPNSYTGNDGFFYVGNVCRLNEAETRTLINIFESHRDQKSPPIDLDCIVPFQGLPKEFVEEEPILDVEPGSGAEGLLAAALSFGRPITLTGDERAQIEAVFERAKVIEEDGEYFGDAIDYLIREIARITGADEAVLKKDWIDAITGCYHEGKESGVGKFLEGLTEVLSAERAASAPARVPELTGDELEQAEKLIFSATQWFPTAGNMQKFIDARSAGPGGFSCPFLGEMDRGITVENGEELLDAIKMVFPALEFREAMTPAMRMIGDKIFTFAVVFPGAITYGQFLELQHIHEKFRDRGTAPLKLPCIINHPVNPPGIRRDRPGSRAKGTTQVQQILTQAQMYAIVEAFDRVESAELLEAGDNDGESAVNRLMEEIAGITGIGESTVKQYVTGISSAYRHAREPENFETKFEPLFEEINKILTIHRPREPGIGS